MDATSAPTGRPKFALLKWLMAHAHHHTDKDIAALRKACLLITSFMLIELGVGLWANALVLVADAGHMFLDATALGLAWWAAHLSTRGGDHQLSYGYHRFQVLAAFVNGLTLAVLIIWITVEAFATHDESRSDESFADPNRCITWLRGEFDRLSPFA